MTNAFNAFKHLKAEELHDSETFFILVAYSKSHPLPDGECPTLSKLVKTWTDGAAELDWKTE